MKCRVLPYLTTIYILICNSVNLKNSEVSDNSREATDINLKSTLKSLKGFGISFANLSLY